MAEIRRALPPLYPFNDDEVAANPEGYRAFLAHSLIGKAQRDSERARKQQAKSRKKARRGA